MTTVRFRNREGSGGIKFRRNLSIDWSIETNLTPESIIGTDGRLIDAVVFGDPYSSDQKSPLLIGDVSFAYFKFSTINLEASTGNQHKIVDGPFFKSRDSILPEELKRLTSLGAWSNNLPPDSYLNLVVANLTPDNVYQIRCMFIDGKNKASSGLILGPGNYEFNYDRQSGVVATGTFTAPSEKAYIKIASSTSNPPHINAVCLRHVGYNPRTAMVGLRTISDLKR